MLVNDGEDVDGAVVIEVGSKAPTSEVSFEKILPTPKSKRALSKRKSFNTSAVLVKKRLFEDEGKEQKKESKIKKGKGNEKKGRGKQMHKSQEPQPSTSDSVLCIYCNMRFDLSCEQWIRCNACGGWACVPCTDAHRHQKGWVCDMCRPS